MSYSVRWTDFSTKQLGKLEKHIAKRIIDRVEYASKDPFRFVEKLKGHGLYKLRIGDYRAIIGIDLGKMVVFVLEVGHRSVIYRKY